MSEYVGGLHNIIRQLQVVVISAGYIWQFKKCFYVSNCSKMVWHRAETYVFDKWLARPGYYNPSRVTDRLFAKYLRERHPEPTEYTLFPHLCRFVVRVQLLHAIRIFVGSMASAATLMHTQYCVLF